MLEWAASVRIAIDPVIAAAAILSVIRSAFEMIETAAARSLRGTPPCASGPTPRQGAMARGFRDSPPVIAAGAGRRRAGPGSRSVARSRWARARAARPRWLMASFSFWESSDMVRPSE